VALAVADDRLYVADARAKTVFAYDLFGSVRRALPLPSLRDVQSLSVHRGRLWVVCADRVLVWDRREGLVAEHLVDLSEPLVDAAASGAHVYLLTASRLYRRPQW
jgi:sugar lactone lactonase YvrE